jgi:Sec-independent protein secretion pathway component TatC
MWFSVGILELGIVGVLLLTAAMLAAFRLPAWRWAMIGVACTIVAAILSLADPLSTLLLGTVLLIFFVSGIRLGGRRPVAAA